MAASRQLEGGVCLRPGPGLAVCLAAGLEARQAAGLATEPPPDMVARAAAGEADAVLGVPELRWVGRHLAASGLGEALLTGALQLPALATAQRSDRLERRCVRLRAEQQEREYRRMTDNVRRDGERNKAEEPIKKQLKEVNGFLLLILQFVVSVVCAFLAGYLGPALLYGHQDVAGRLLLGVVAGFAVGCADMYFVIRQLLEEDGIKLRDIDIDGTTASLKVSAAPSPKTEKID
jgi:hypothetical protein